ncbi:DUF1669 domain-containing protein [Clostridioides difficile]|nr:DUF1669 domain-containing protein [Clostridioides difficile]EGT4669059.1 DUF1669 domain-containing protein [Clostridioides difficile]
MKLDEFTINKLVEIINGESINGEQITPYNSGRQLVELFNEYGFRDIYGSGFPSRRDYTKDKLKQINGTKEIEKFINNFVHSRQYIDSSFDVNIIVDKVNTYINYNGYKLEKFDNEYIVTGEGLLKDDAVEVKVTFENIQEEIIKEIRKAKYIIWVAVAWFTDRVLFDELIKKKQEGVNVQVIVIDDEINRNSGLNYEEHFETQRKRKFGVFGENILHHKFCVIDLNTVIHGSYNWSKKAQYNDESIDILKNQEHAQKYADRFKELKLKG